jgi:hypothetical protein
MVRTENENYIDVISVVSEVLREVQLSQFWTLFKTERLGDWILSPYSGGTYSV